MSQDRRPVEDNEILGLFEFYLRRYCEENKTDTVVVTNSDGKQIFSAKLLSK